MSRSLTTKHPGKNSNHPGKNSKPLGNIREELQASRKELEASKKHAPPSPAVPPGRSPKQSSCWPAAGYPVGLLPPDLRRLPRPLRRSRRGPASARAKLMCCLRISCENIRTGTPPAQGLRLLQSEDLHLEGACAKML